VVAIGYLASEVVRADTQAWTQDPVDSSVLNPVDEDKAQGEEVQRGDEVGQVGGRFFVCSSGLDLYSRVGVEGMGPFPIGHRLLDLVGFAVICWEVEVEGGEMSLVEAGAQRWEVVAAVAVVV